MAYAFNDDKSKFDLDETLVGSMATIETSPVITNHSTGEYIMYNGTLLKVLSPIATGENLVLGTNVTPINFGDEIKDLQDSVDYQTAQISGHEIYFTKFGKICTCEGIWSAENLTANTNKTLSGIVPSWARPSSSYVECFFNGGSNSTSGKITLNRNDLTFKPTSTVQYVNFFMAYACA